MLFCSYMLLSFSNGKSWVCFPAVPNPIDPDPLLLHGLLHVHVPGELAHLLHRRLRRQEERNPDEESKSTSRLGNPIGSHHGK